MYGVLLIALSFAMYFVGVLMSPVRILLGLNPLLLRLNEWIVWYSGVPMILGLLLAAADLFLFFPSKRQVEGILFDPVPAGPVTVALTAYNDEDSIVAAVEDFRSHPGVGTVIVVSNNSSDATLARAAAAGALAFNEERQGYGYCVHRCLSEAVKLGESEIVILCEGDRTFRAYDMDKLLAYAPHGDIVNGTRTVEGLRAYHTQLSTFMYYGNLFVGKLLEAKHLGRSTITDVGTTYKLCRRSAVEALLPTLRPDRVNLEFNAYFLDTALSHDYRIIECPITFHARVGVSKGGNTNNLRALQVGARMIAGIIFDWAGTKAA
jgi:glycosyltransferase involved in cell wall biosynthesis